MDKLLEVRILWYSAISIEENLLARVSFASYYHLSRYLRRASKGKLVLLELFCRQRLHYTSILVFMHKRAKRLYYFLTVSVTKWISWSEQHSTRNTEQIRRIMLAQCLCNFEDEAQNKSVVDLGRKALQDTPEGWEFKSFPAIVKTLYRNNAIFYSVNHNHSSNYIGQYSFDYCKNSLHIKVS